MTGPAPLRIRYAGEADLPAIVDIYNQSIPAGWSTADTQPVTVVDRVGWFRKFDREKRPIWVAQLDGQVAALTYLRETLGLGQRLWPETAVSAWCGL